MVSAINTELAPGSGWPLPPSGMWWERMPERMRKEQREAMLTEKQTRTAILTTVWCKHFKFFLRGGFRACTPKCSCPSSKAQLWVPPSRAAAAQPSKAGQWLTQSLPGYRWHRGPWQAQSCPMSRISLLRGAGSPCRLFRWSHLL